MERFASKAPSQSHCGNQALNKKAHMELFLFSAAVAELETTEL